MVDSVAAFFAVAAVVIVTPGPDTALTIRNTLLGGRRAGFFTALGVSTGQATWTVATSAGVSARLVASEPAFAAVRTAGAAYLIFLGVQALYGALAQDAPLRDDARLPDRPRPGLAPHHALRQGVISNLTNPKMAAFFPALLPQFTRDGEAAFPALLVLGFLFSVMTLVWLAAYAFAVSRAAGFLARTSIRRSLEAATGAVLVGLGLRLAAGSR